MWSGVAPISSFALTAAIFLSVFDHTFTTTFNFWVAKEKQSHLVVSLNHFYPPPPNKKPESVLNAHI